MVRHLAVVVAVVASILALAAPASAGLTWSIRNPSGSVLGSVVRSSKYKAGVYDQLGGLGEVGVDGIGINWFAFIYLGGHSVGYGLIKVKASRWRVELEDTVAVRTHSRWVVKRRIHGEWRRVASAPRRCPGQFALGGAKVLLDAPPSTGD